MSQGGNAVRAGKALEDFVEDLARREGFLIKTNVEHANNKDLFSVRILVKRVPFETVWESEGHSEFVLEAHDLMRTWRVECKSQLRKGSTDQKLFATFLNLQQVPEDEAILLIGGPGFQSKIVTAIKKMSEKHNQSAIRPKISVMSMDEYYAWFRKTFAKAAA